MNNALAIELERLANANYRIARVYALITQHEFASAGPQVSETSYACNKSLLRTLRASLVVFKEHRSFIEQCVNELIDAAVTQREARRCRFGDLGLGSTRAHPTVGIVTATRVPLAGRAAMLNVPPKSRARSCIPSSPSD